MYWMNRFFNFDQAETDGDNAGGGSQGDADGAADGADAGSNDNTVDSGADGGDTSGKPAWEQDEIVWNGEKKKLSRQEIINYAQQAYNVTQKEQNLAKLTKDATDRLARIDALAAELEKNDGEGADEQAPEDDEPVSQLSKEVQALKLKEQIRTWDNAFKPIADKYPDISEKALLAEMREKVASKEVDDNAEGLMKVAESMANEREGTVSKRLEALLKENKDPRLQAYRKKSIEDYVAGKIKLANAGGEGGGSPAGAKPQTSKSIDDVATRIRGTIGSD